MVFKGTLNHLVNKQDWCKKCHSLIRCQYCPTEVSVEAKRLNEDFEGGFIAITKWQILGCGLSPSEAHWKNHLEKSLGISMAIPSILYARKYLG